VSFDGTIIPRSDNASFLGVILDSRLSWDSHVSSLRKKLCSVCFLVRSIKFTVNNEVLISIYYGEFYSHVIYSILFWGPLPCAHVVFKIQKKIVRLMCSAPLRAPCRPLFKKLSILPIPCVYMLNAIICAKRNFGLYATNDSIHNHYTRNCGNLHVKFTRTRKTSLSPQNMGLILYNKLPRNIKSVEKISSFKFKVKEFFMVNLFYSIDEYLTMTM
jgi:hypothetical protein